MYEEGMRVRVTIQDADGGQEVVEGTIVLPMMREGAFIRLSDGDRVLAEQEDIEVI